MFVTAASCEEFLLLPSRPCTNTTLQKIYGWASWCFFLIVSVPIMRDNLTCLPNKSEPYTLSFKIQSLRIEIFDNAARLAAGAHQIKETLCSIAALQHLLCASWPWDHRDVDLSRALMQACGGSKSRFTIAKPQKSYSEFICWRSFSSKLRHSQGCGSGGAGGRFSQLFFVKSQNLYSGITPIVDPP